MPIQPNQTYEKKEGNSYPTLPKGLYTCELLDVKAVQNETYNSKTGKTEKKEYQTDLSWQFTILKGRDESQEKEEMKELRGRNVWENFGHNFLYIGKNGKNNLYRIVEAFIRRELTREEEMKGITSDQLNRFIGKQVMLSIEPKTSKAGKIFDNIIDYLKIDTLLTALTKEEREKATVKEDKAQEQAPVAQEVVPNFDEPASAPVAQEQVSNGNIAVENLPF